MKTGKAANLSASQACDRRKAMPDGTSSLNAEVLEQRCDKDSIGADLRSLAAQRSAQSEDWAKHLEEASGEQGKAAMNGTQAKEEDEPNGDRRQAQNNRHAEN